MEYHNPEKQYHSSEHLMFSCQYHVIFCPKYRRKVLTPPKDEDLKNIFLEVAEQYHFCILDMEVMPDHVHLLIDCSPRFGIMRCVHRLKGISARKMRERYPDLQTKLPTLLTRSAFISSVGAVSLSVVQKYIEDQKNR